MDETEIELKPHLSDYVVDGKYMFGGFDYKTPDHLIRSGILGFADDEQHTPCLRHIMHGLSIYDERFQNVPQHGTRELSRFFDKWNQKLMGHFKTREAMYFFFCWADDRDFMDYGTSFPGFLTDNGRALLSLLKEWSELPTMD